MYTLEPVDSAELADGHRWMFVVPPEGGVFFALDRTRPIIFPDDLLCQVLHLIEEKVAARAS